MSVIQVSRSGSQFVVLEDGVAIPNSRKDTRGEAVKFAIDYKENN